MDTVQSVDGFLCRELCRRCNYDKESLILTAALLQKRIDEQSNYEPKELTNTERAFRNHGFMSLVGTEYINETSIHNFSIQYCYTLLELIQRTLTHPSFPVVTIFDNFKSHPNYMNHVRQTYIDIFAEIATSSMLNCMLTEITGIPTHIEKMSNTLNLLIKDSEYALS